MKSLKKPFSKAKNFMTLTVGITNVGHTLYMYIFVLVCVCLHLSTYCTVSHKMKYKFLQQEISILLPLMH